MNLYLCTISFRHQLISLDQIAQWATRQRFQGIELWGVHAKNLSERPEYDIDWLHSKNLCVPMISDYFPVQGDRKVALNEAAKLCRLAQAWRAPKVRTFAGDRASAAVSSDERKAWVVRIRELCEVAQAHGLQLVVETHPNTLADTPSSTLQLLTEIDHPALRLNFDVIHVWEAGADPLAVFRDLQPFVAHMHLKNIAAREQLAVFAPANVYAPMGNRSGMVRLFDGAFDFSHFLESIMTEFQISWEGMDASLEWFGSDVLSTLAHDGVQLRQFESEHLSSSRRAPGNAVAAPAPR
jgi:3-dehydroshikimate dehydratase